MPVPRFTQETLAFLRQLARHNDREWFREHRHDYEEHVRGPMLALIEQLAFDLPAIAPDLVATRRPPCTASIGTPASRRTRRRSRRHVAGIFPHRALPKHEGAGLYVHVAADQVFIGGGLYRPQPRQLHRLREHIAANSDHLRTLVAAPRLPPQLRRAVRRAAQADAPRLCRRPSGRGPAPPEAVPRRLRAPFGVCCRSPVLPVAPPALHPPCATHRVPQRTARDTRVPAGGDLPDRPSFQVAARGPRPRNRPNPRCEPTACAAQRPVRPSTWRSAPSRSG